MSYYDADIAIDFAYANRRTNKFCAKMVKLFEVTGYLTHNQINALLRIRAER